jgi:hypothetical protein
MAFAVLAQPNDPDFITLLDEAVLDVVMAVLEIAVFVRRIQQFLRIFPEIGRSSQSELAKRLLKGKLFEVAASHSR